MTYAQNIKQGKFFPSNPHKYQGDYFDINYRSAWEQYFMYFLDTSSSITAWRYEPMAIKYRCPIDEDYKRYYPDFYIETRSGRKILIEIKPDRFTRKPEHWNPEEFAQYRINESKWYFANKFCERKGFEFLVLTEHTLSQLPSDEIPIPPPQAFVAPSSKGGIIRWLVALAIFGALIWGLLTYFGR